MKRNSFLKFCVTVGAFVSLPFDIIAKPFGKKRMDKGVRIDAGRDRFDEAISLFEGDKFYCKVSTKDTEGDLYIFESTRDKKGGPSFHYHYNQDEWWYILEGAFLFKVGDQSFTAKAGDSIFGPRMVPHTFAKINDGIARMLIGFQPAGSMEEFFKKIADGVTKSMTEDEKFKFRKDHGFETVGPALTFLKQ